MAKNIKNIRKRSNIPKNCRERYLLLSGDTAQPLISKGINFSGISNLRHGYQVGYLEATSRHMIIFTKSGEGYLETPFHDYSLTEGSFISVPPGNACMFGVSDDQWDILWFYMLDIPYWELLKERGIIFKQTTMIPKLESVMEGYLSEARPGNPENRAASLFAELIIFYLGSAQGIHREQEINETKGRLENIWHRVQKNPAEKWGKHEMACELHVSPSTFDRMVKKYYNITPWQKIIQIRMEQAKMLLSRTDYPLKLIAERLGYANEFIFSNAFKKYSSLSPKFYRQKNA